MVEGSLWVYGQTRLSDYYEDRITLREIANRFYALPYEAPIWRVLEAEEARREEQREAAEFKSILTKFQKAEVKHGR